MSDFYSETAVARNYDVARSLPLETTALWLDEVSAAISRHSISRVLDLGCGTGRFTSALAERFQCPVIGVEPSEAMLDVAAAGESLDIEWRQGEAESIPLPDEHVDLVFMSQVFHHLIEPVRALEEIARVLTPSGYLAIRNSTLGHIKDFEWLKFFPQALDIEKDRTPSVHEIVKTVTHKNFVAVSNTTIRQLFASSYEEYFEKISQRGLSSLIAISDAEFQQGLDRFKHWVERQPANAAVYEPVDLFVFRKD